MAQYLEKHPDIVHIALAFEFQVFPEVPFEAHDILPQMLVTEKRIIRPEETSERTLEEIGRRAKAAEPVLRIMGTTKKNEVLLHVADALIKEQNYILGKNAKDVEIAKENGMEPGMVDRLMLTEDRIAGMAEGIRQVAALPDPVGEVTSMKQRPNGLMIGWKKVPLGVIGMIYESRPNVTADAFSLCFKAGNVVILRGGSDAFLSNCAITKVIRTALAEMDIPEDAVQLIEDTSRETVKAFMQLNQYVDVLIPRGGVGLIRSVVENSRIPVIETGTGNCHIFVDESADFDMAIDIIFNAKTQRIGVCNACESIVVHRAIAKEFLPCLPVYQPVHQIKSGHYSKQYIHSNDVYMQFPSITHRGTTQKQKSGYRRRITKPGTKLQNVLFVNPHIGTCPKEHDSRHTQSRNIRFPGGQIQNHQYQYTVSFQKPEKQIEQGGQYGHTK